MGEGRSPIVAVIMTVIPFVGLYLIYCWWNEIKAKWKLEDVNPLINTLLCCIPIVQLYFIYKLMATVDEQAKAAGKGGYPLGPLILFIIGMFTGIGMLYIVYKTQAMLNE